MRLIAVIFLVFSFNVLAQRNLGRETFMVNVRPILNGILNDFYEMTALFPDFNPEMISVIRDLKEVNELKENLAKSCPHKINKSCKQTIDSLRSIFSKLVPKSFELLTRLRITSSRDISSLSALRLIMEFQADLENIKGVLDNSSFLLVAEIPQQTETLSLIRDIDQLKPLISLAFIEQIPMTYKEDFRHFYFNFVDPLENYISTSTNYEFMNKNVSGLNFTLNLLNQILTKRKKTPAGMAPYLSTIHNRWNSVIRYYY